MDYLIDKIENYSNEELKRLYLEMPKYVQMKIKKKAFVQNQKQTLIGYYLLRKLLFKNYQMSIFPELTENPFGKPYFKDTNIFFNISHSNNLVACAVSTQNIGIDIEKVAPKKAKLFDFVCNPIEYEQIINSERKDYNFILLWTKKESYLKYVGEGINGKIKEILNGVEEERFHTHSYFDGNEEYLLTIFQ